MSFSGYTQATGSIHQKDTITRSVRLITGISAGHYVFGEIGIAKNSNLTVGNHRFWSAYYGSIEFGGRNKMIVAPKVGAWAAGGVGGIGIGVNMMYCTDFHNGSIVFRPEAGIGISNIKIAYGYNAILSSYKLDGINRNLVSLVYYFRLKSLSDKVR